MQTTGTVLLNARGCNINGYDCFVNLSKDTNKYLTEAYMSNTQWRISSRSSYIGVDNSKTKFSNYSLKNSNNYIVSILNNIGLTRSVYDFTVSSWSYTSIFSNAPNDAAYSSRGNFTNRSFVDLCFWSGGSTTSPTTATIGPLTESSHSSTNLSGKFDKWTHFALTRSGNTLKAFIDGSIVYNKTWTDANTSISIGGGPYCEQWFDDVVIIKDHCLWTSNFTPQSTYLLDSEYAVDLDKVKRRNIIAANVDKKLIIPDDDTFKQY